MRWLLLRGFADGTIVICHMKAVAKEGAKEIGRFRMNENAYCLVSVGISVCEFNCRT